MGETQAFKFYYNVDLAASLGQRLQALYPAFDAQAFVDEIAAEVDSLEFKDRIALFSRALSHQLPREFSAAWAILEQLMDDELTVENGIFTDGYELWPLAHFIEVYGVEDFDPAMDAMVEITKRHTAEFAIRPYLIRYPQPTMARLQIWVEDESPHVRRLVSEGIRPGLPWASRLDAFIADPTPTLALLERLKDDPSPYVRRSVANHLNDISKDHPALVVETLARWRRGASQERQWIIRHALRTLVKQGDPAALAVLGYAKPQASLTALHLEPKCIKLGDRLAINVTLQSESDMPQDLVIDYAVHFVLASGKTGRKVFKLTTRRLEGGETIQLTKSHHFRPITTRRYYPGAHRVEIQVNGQVLGEDSFELQVEP
jgi:3-methyladenine DNA glycosylase AlkC